MTMLRRMEACLILPMPLAPVDATIGVITDNACGNPLGSHLIPGLDDGKVAIGRVHLAEMADFLVMPASHTFLMDDDDVISQTVHCLPNDRFDYSSGNVRRNKPACISTPQPQ